MPRQWTEAQKRERAEQVRKYWQEHEHPSRGCHHNDTTLAKMKKRKQRGPILGHCIICQRALYSKASAKRGMGSECAGLT